MANRNVAIHNRSLASYMRVRCKGKEMCVCVCVCDDAKDNQEKERFLNVIQESGTSTQREGNPRITAGHTADLERNQFRMG